MAKAINGHSTPESAMAMAIVAIPVAPPLRGRFGEAGVIEFGLKDASNSFWVTLAGSRAKEFTCFFAVNATS